MFTPGFMSISTNEHLMHKSKNVTKRGKIKKNIRKDQPNYEKRAFIDKRTVRLWSVDVIVHNCKVETKCGRVSKLFQLNNLNTFCCPVSLL